MNKRFFLLALVLALLDSFGQKTTAPPEPVFPVPSAEQLAWHRMEMNAFIHFTTNTFTDLEWGFGDEKPAIFNPVQADPGQWVALLKEIGFKGIILTAKHHDGFCLWPSKYTEHSVKNSPYKNGQGDIVKELSEACKNHGLKSGIYVSPWDRNQPDYGKPEYLNYYRNQLTELITRYGPFFEIWFDGANGGDGYYGGSREKRRIDGRTYYNWPGTIAMVNKINPGAIFFSDAGPGCRWVGNESGVAGETNWNTISIDTLYAGKPNCTDLLNTGSENGRNWVPAECDVSIRPGWFYHAREDSLVKTPEQLFEIYLTSVGRGSNLLLNVPPDRRGLLHENDIKALRGFKKILDESFKTNLAKNAKVKTSSIRGNDRRYAGENMLDGDPETYWATNDDEKSATIDLYLNASKTVRFIVIQEYIRLGQRVKSFRVEAGSNGKWQTLAVATTIGHKRILKVEPVKAEQIRISILDAKACPVISAVAVY